MDKNLSFNPFLPQSIASVSVFSGRDAELAVIQSCFRQFKFGQPSHFCIEGERGIGKSSFLQCVERLAHAEPNGFAVGQADLGHCNTATDLIVVITLAAISAIETAPGPSGKGREAGLAILNELALTGEAPLDRLADRFVDGVVALWADPSPLFEGLLLLLDEADHAPVEAGLGRLIKLVTERLARRHCPRVTFGLAGLTGLPAALRASHESSSRLFTRLTLQWMTREEVNLVIDQSLDYAEQLSGMVLTVTPDGRNALFELSQGHPYLLQHFAHHAFEFNSDEKIDEADVTHAATAKGGALDQLADWPVNTLYAPYLFDEVDLPRRTASASPRIRPVPPVSQLIREIAAGTQTARR